jgi:ribosomal subunit interface protein
MCPRLCVSAWRPASRDAGSKYFNRPAEAFVVASKEGYGFKVDISLHLPSGAFLQASGSAEEAYSAAEDAAGHLEKRLRRYKRRLKDHQSGPKADLPAAESTPVLVLRSDRRAVEVPEDELEEDDGGAVGGDEPVIIAEQPAELKTLTVSMAVLEMDLGRRAFCAVPQRRERRDELRLPAP